MFSLSDARALAQLAREAGALILRIREQHHAKTHDWAHAAKEDGSPVTRADQEAEAHILAGIAKLGLNAPVVAEETASLTALQGADSFYLIDPLDGTKAFVNGGDDFCVNIGLTEKHRPRLGVIYVPVSGETYFTDGASCWFQPAGGNEEKVAVRTAPASGYNVIINRTEDWSGRLKNYLANFPVHEITPRSSAHKFALMARGLYDLYPRFGKSYEWDTAAGDALLRAAGGTVVTLEGDDLAYGKPGFVNPPFVARGNLGRV